MADGGRFVDSDKRRITEDGQARITEHAVLLHAVLDRSAALACIVQQWESFATFNAQTNLTCHMTRRRNIAVTFTAKAGGASTSADLRLGAQATFSAQAHMQAGYNVISHRRMTEDGKLRITHPPGVRVVQHSPDGRRILVRRPPFRIFNNSEDVWGIVYPSAKYDSQWQLPLHISVKNGGAWRAVVEPQSD